LSREPSRAILAVGTVQHALKPTAYPAFVSKQVIGEHGEMATLLSTPYTSRMSDKPCRTPRGITGSPRAVCRIGGEGVDRPVNYSGAVLKNARSRTMERSVDTLIMLLAPKKLPLNLEDVLKEILAFLKTAELGYHRLYARI
jgi:hypothetical protein